jgi:hypothetical protein
LIWKCAFAFGAADVAAGCGVEVDVDAGVAVLVAVDAADVAAGAGVAVPVVPDALTMTSAFMKG